MKREVESALEPWVVGELLAEQAARLGDDAVAQRALGGDQRGAQLGVGARRGAQLHRDLEELAGEALPQQLEHRVGARGRVLDDPQLRGEHLELSRAHLGEVIDGGDEQLGLRREVVEEGAARDVGAALDLEGRGAREADLDERFHGGVEEGAPRLVAALLLGARDAGRDEHDVVYLATNSQSRLFVAGPLQEWSRTQRSELIVCGR